MHTFETSNQGYLFTFSVGINNSEWPNWHFFSEPGQTTRKIWTTNWINCRVGKASAAFNQLTKIWKNKTFFIKSKLRFYNSNVLSTLLYGCETWSLKTAQERKLDAFDTRCLRKILGHPLEWLHFKRRSQKAVQSTSSTLHDLQATSELARSRFTTPPFKTCPSSTVCGGPRLVRGKGDDPRCQLRTYI